MLPLIAPRLPRVPDRRERKGASLSKLLERIHDGAEERRSHKDRRGTPRVAITLDVHAATAGKQKSFTTNDLSTFGLSLTGGPTPKKGALLALTLVLPDGPEPVLLQGEVLGPLDASGGARVRFVKPPVDALRRIHRFLK